MFKRGKLVVLKLGVLQSVLPVYAAVPYFTLKAYVQARHRDSAQRFYD